MSLLNFDGSVKYVWNPFSLQQLKVKLGAFDTYLECVASKNNGECTAPTDEIFRKQQIPMISVYQRCLSNYQEMTWDQGTHVLFNKTLQRNVKLDKTIPAVEDTLGVAPKLLEAKANGFDNTAVLDMFLGGQQSTDYFKYSNITTPNPGSAQIDACLTFSGPSKIANLNISKPFTACLESYANRSGCDIPHMLWSGRSTNKVPVATQHTLIITDPAVRLKMASGEMEATQSKVLGILDELEKKWTGENLKITIFSADGDLLHQYADCVMQGPMGSMTLTPGPDGVEKVIWSRSSDGNPSRHFELPCSGERLTNRDGITRDDVPPFTCGTYARRAVLKHFLRVTYGGEKENLGAKNSVIKEVRALINRTREAWTFKSNFLCTCQNGTTGWGCCEMQKNCATDPCQCPDGYSTKASVACCTSVCGGLAGTGIMEPFSKIKGEKLAVDLLAGAGLYMKNDIWTSKDPWLKFDPLGDESYKKSWTSSEFEVGDAGLFDASNPVVYYDEITYPFKATFWEHCAGLLQQVIWTMPIDRNTGRPKIPSTKYDPVTGKSLTPNMTYTEEFIQSLTVEAYKSSPLFWHYNIKHTPTQSEVCRRSTPRQPLQNNNEASFQVNGKTASRMGFSSMTIGGLGGVDCYCGWWLSSTECLIPEQLCSAMVQIIGFRRICIDQNRIYNSVLDHLTVLAAIASLKEKQPDTQYPCPALQISEHWGLMDTSTGMPFANTTDEILREGVSGFRLGNTDWLFASQSSLINPYSRIDQAETSSTSSAIECNTSNGDIINHFIDDLFPSAKGVRQSMPQSYCTRYGIELARLVVYKTANLISAASEQQGLVDRWKKRCQFKLEELAVCNSFRVLDATGGPTETAQCPFTLSVITSLSKSYAVTPGCLLVIWNTAGGSQDGIYDPCICVSCTKTPNIDVPAQLTSICKLESLQTLVAKDVIPGEADSGVPLGSGSFRTLMDKPGFLQINTPNITHWALHTAIRDADLVLDWWPEEWTHPVGYHVTPGCSRPNDAHWRTFDSSWRWDSQTEKLHLAKDETNDPMLNRNAFGASGVCRTNNFGMPLVVLNTMAVCTKENSNSLSDPMVPAPSKPDTWVDGKENCASDHSSTPWEVDITINPPRQWTVGTLHHPKDNNRLNPLSASEWGGDCGPYPLRTCVTTDDCAAGLTCIRSSSGKFGVCGSIKQGNFECTAHAQCPNDKMCAGDGICVDGVWQIQNNIPEPIAFRTFSQECSTGVPLDTWGTSMAEGIPDILNASGLCSYRSWFENRRMSQRNGCTQTDTCSGVSGLQPWNFTSPKRKKSAGESAFDSQVLKIKAHVCDRDYHFMEGFMSCTPSGNFARMYRKEYNVFDPTGTQLQTDNRTLTYRPDDERHIPIIHHMDNFIGPTYGFTGIPQTYAQLQLGKNNPGIIPCSSLRTCGFQPIFKVNGMKIDQRLVIDNGVVRGYGMQDLLQCGVFGYQTQDGMCIIDYAVAPLAGFFLLQHSDLLNEREYADISDLKESYTPGTTADVWLMLKKIPDLIISQYVGGGTPVLLQDYITKSSIFTEIYNAINRIDKPSYAGVGTPRQIYKLTRYGAYEVPFAWWFKCSFIAGISITTDNPISSSQCSWRVQGDSQQGTTFGAYDDKLAILLGIGRQSRVQLKTTTLTTLLIKLPGVITQGILDKAKDDYTSKRNQWIDKIALILASVRRTCFGRKEFIPEFNAESERYQLQRLSQIYEEVPFDLQTPYLGKNNKTELCRGDDCLQSVDRVVPTGTNSDFSKTLADKMKAANVNVNPINLKTKVADDDNVAFRDLFNSTQIPSQFWTEMAVSFRNDSSGCKHMVTLTSEDTQFSCLCSRWNRCSAAVQTQMLKSANIRVSPSETEIAELNFVDKGAVDLCKVMKGADSEGKCFVNDQLSLSVGLNQEEITAMRIPLGASIELYDEERWNCVRLTCDERSPDFNNKMVPRDFTSWASTTEERVVIDEIEYNQLIPVGKSNTVWPDAATEANELNCENSRGRLQDVLEEVYVSGGGTSGWEKRPKCRPTCNIISRVISAPTTVRFKRTKIKTFPRSTCVLEMKRLWLLRKIINLKRW